MVDLQQVFCEEAQLESRRVKEREAVRVKEREAVRVKEREAVRARGVGRNYVCEGWLAWLRSLTLLHLLVSVEVVRAVC
jgi:hypothetical protein